MHEHNQDNQDLSVKLTAYLLGELDASETQEMDRALAASAELRAEKAQLEQVIGLVREHGAEEASLSDEAREAIVAEAGGGKVLSFLERQMPQRFATAASVLLLVGMAGAVYWMGQLNTSGEAEVMELASADRRVNLSRTEEKLGDRVDRDQLRVKEKAPADKPHASTERSASAGVVVKTIGLGASLTKKGSKELGGAAPALPQAITGSGNFSAVSGGQSTPSPSGAQATNLGGPGTPGPNSNSLIRSRRRAGGRVSTGGQFGGRGLGIEPVPEREPLRAQSAWFNWGPVDSVAPPSELGLMEIGYAGTAVHQAEPVISGGLIAGLDKTEEIVEDESTGFFPGHGESFGLDEKRQRIEQRVQGLLHSCRPYPGEEPAAMFFRFWGDNPFVHASLDAQSTFGVDVDTASYTLARRYLSDGLLPEKAQIRTEEFLNYFKPDIDAPTEGVFRVQTELAPSRFGGPDDKWMLRVTVRGKDVAREERQPLNLTFVVDVSGSMKQNGRLETVKHGLRLLTAQLDANDSVSLVAYSTEARIVLPMTSAASRALIEEAIHSLQPGGGTNAEAGLKMGYAAAADQVTTGRHHRVVLLSDGVANIGQTDQDRINADIKKYRDRGIYLNTIGVGMENHNDTFLEQLANKGDGICNYIDDEKEARRALVENFIGAFEPIARDVKIQVEFEAGVVKRYRQIGYENRAIADVDFRNDAVDAGEVGAGHQVTALYELELEPNAALVKAPLAIVRLRWKEPTGAGRDPAEDAATEREWSTSMNRAVSWEGASYGFRRAACVAQFAELLRRSEHARNDTLEDLIAEAQRLEREYLAGTLGADDDFVEFLALLERSREVILKKIHKPTPLEDCVRQLMERRYRHHSCIILQEEAEAIGRLKAEISVLEAKVREIVEQESF
jgi:Ca-activated chloride channel family protein